MAPNTTTAISNILNNNNNNNKNKQNIKDKEIFSIKKIDGSKPSYPITTTTTETIYSINNKMDTSAMAPTSLQYTSSSTTATTTKAATNTIFIRIC